jgi:hypothetical protein
MRMRSCWLVLLFLAFGPWTFAQQSSSLVGTWVGKVQGFGVEMKLALNADGSADYEGVLGKWRVQGSKLLLTQEGETVAYNFALRGSQLTLSGGDLMAPMVMTRAGGAGAARGVAPSVREPKVEEAPPSRRATRPGASTRGLSEAKLIELLEAGVPSRRLTELVEEMGITFAATPAVTSRLKAKGATKELIAALRGAGGGVQPAEPPVRAETQAATRTRSAAPAREFLAGQYYYISASSYGSSERYINMCSDGRFSSQSGTYSSGSAGTAYGEGGQSAQWTAEGDERQGVIIVTYPNGNTERHEYQRSGSDLIVNGRTFARYGDGSCTKTSIY